MSHSIKVILKLFFFCLLTYMFLANKTKFHKQLEVDRNFNINYFNIMNISFNILALFNLIRDIHKKTLEYI